MAVARLQAACEEGLGWLRKQFWERLPGDQAAAEGDCTGEARVVLVAFRKRRLQEVQKGGGAESVREETEALMELVRRWGAGALVEAVVEVLVGEGMLYPKGYRGGSLEGAFVVWEGLVRVMCRVWDALAARLARELCLVREGLGKGAEGEVAAAKGWMERMSMEEWGGIRGLSELRGEARSVLDLECYLEADKDVSASMKA